MKAKETIGFILAYKEELSAKETDHDWEDLKVLKSYVANKLTASAAKKNYPVVVNDQPAPAIDNTNINAISNSSNNIPHEIKTENSGKKPSGEVMGETYDAILLKGYTLFQSRKYAEARVFYEKAALLKPDEKIAKSKIEEIDTILSEIARRTASEQENQKKEQEYNEKIKAADNTFANKNFEEAKGLYSLALSLKPGDFYAKKRFEESQRKMDDLIALNRNKDKEESFQKNIIAGKKAFEEKKYEEARAAYSLAIDLKPSDQFSRTQIKAIDKILKDIAQHQETDKKNKEKESSYIDAVTVANDAFNNGNYTAALSEYRKAKVIKDDPYLNDQIKKINQIITETAQKEASEKVRLEKERQNNEFYKNYLVKADQAFELKQYREARISYKQALNYKDEQHPKERLSEIDKIEIKVAEENELKIKYNNSVLKGKAALANGDFNKARIYYEDAAAFKPSDAFSQEQLKTIYKKLDDIVKEKEKNDSYDICLSKAAAAIGTMDYKKAQDLYKEAGVLKPKEDYPAKMIVYLEGVLSEEAERQKLSEIAKQRRKIIEIKEKASQSIVQKNWNEALEGFKEILTLNPAKADEEFAKQKISAIEAEISKTASENALKKEPVAVIPKGKREKDQAKRDAIFAEAQARKEKQRLATIDEQLKNLDKKKQEMAAISNSNINRADYSSANAYLQSDPIPYSHADLIKKYPAINFDETPAGQTYDASDRKNRALNFYLSNRIIDEKGDINVYDSVNNIKAICKNIFFNESNSYIKLIVKNNGAADFLTGSLQLKLIKKNGTIIELNQRFISNFPVIMPKKEFPIIYVTNASVDLDSTDILIMEVNDRIKKTKLRINIPVDIYNRQKTAKL